MMTNKQIVDALVRLCPGAKWTLAGDNFDDIEWLCECAKPSKSAINAEIAKEPEIAAEKMATKQAILDRLGITADEAALLLG